MFLQNSAFDPYCRSDNHSFGFNLYEDPFFNLNNADPGFIKNIIDSSNNQGTYFHKFHGRITKDTFFQVYRNIPSSLKTSYLFIKDGGGVTILHRIASNPDLKLIKALIKSLNQDQIFDLLKTESKDYHNPMHWACMSKNFHTAYFMLNSIDDKERRDRLMTAQDINGITPLHFYANFPDQKQKIVELIS